MTGRERKFWGWGFEDQQPLPEEVERVGLRAREHLGSGPRRSSGRRASRTCVSVRRA